MTDHIIFVEKKKKIFFLLKKVLNPDLRIKWDCMNRGQVLNLLHNLWLGHWLSMGHDVAGIKSSSFVWWPRQRRIFPQKSLEKQLYISPSTQYHLYFQAVIYDSPSIQKGILTLCMLGKRFSWRHFEIFFLFFLETGIWHFMQTVSWGQFALSVKSYFLGKTRKILLICGLLNLSIAW